MTVVIEIVLSLVYLPLFNLFIRSFSAIRSFASKFDTCLENGSRILTDLLLIQGDKFGHMITIYDLICHFSFFSLRTETIVYFDCAC